MIYCINFSVFIPVVHIFSFFFRSNRLEGDLPFPGECCGIAADGGMDGQALAAHEGVGSDLPHTGWEGDVLQARAVPEGQIVDGLHPLRNRDAVQTGAAVEGPQPD